IIVVLTPQSMSEMKKTASALSAFKDFTGKKIIALFLGGKLVRESNHILEESNIPYFNTLEEAREALIFN
ncbi:MAG: hypothetical protein Q8L27_01125, partial [archaeon]|nr:hypothetical protein [archaeon]